MFFPVVLKDLDAETRPLLFPSLVGDAG